MISVDQQLANYSFINVVARALFVASPMCSQRQAGKRRREAPNSLIGGSAQQLSGSVTSWTK